MDAKSLKFDNMLKYTGNALLSFSLSVGRLTAVDVPAEVSVCRVDARGKETAGVALHDTHVAARACKWWQWLLLSHIQGLSSTDWQNEASDDHFEDD